MDQAFPQGHTEGSNRLFLKKRACLLLFLDPMLLAVSSLETHTTPVQLCHSFAVFAKLTASLSILTILYLPQNSQIPFQNASVTLCVPEPPGQCSHSAHEERLNKCKSIRTLLLL